MYKGKLQGFSFPFIPFAGVEDFVTWKFFSVFILGKSWLALIQLYHSSQTDYHLYIRMILLFYFTKILHWKWEMSCGYSKLKCTWRWLLSPEYNKIPIFMPTCVVLLSHSTNISLFIFNVCVVSYTCIKCNMQKLCSGEANIWLPFNSQ